MDLALKVKSQKIESLDLTPPNVTPSDPDFDAASTLVADTIEESSKDAEKDKGAQTAPAALPEPLPGSTQVLGLLGVWAEPIRRSVRRAVPKAALTRTKRARREKSATCPEADITFPEHGGSVLSENLQQIPGKSFSRCVPCKHWEPHPCNLLILLFG